MPKYESEPVAVFPLQEIKSNSGTPIPINLIDTSTYLPVEEIAKVIGSDKVLVRKAYSPCAMPWVNRSKSVIGLQSALDYLCDLAYDRVISKVSVFRGSFSGKPLYDIEMQDSCNCLVGIQILPFMDPVPSAL